MRKGVSKEHPFFIQKYSLKHSLVGVFTEKLERKLATSPTLAKVIAPALAKHYSLKYFNNPFEFSKRAATFVASSHSTLDLRGESIYKEAWRDRLYEALATTLDHSGKGAKS